MALTHPLEIHMASQLFSLEMHSLDVLVNTECLFSRMAGL